MATTVVFHTPYPLNPEATSASGIRPVRMRNAFRDLGCTVFDVTGYAADRKRGIAAVEDYIRGGGTIDLVYSESSTMPTLMTEPHHLPTHPHMDFQFLGRLAKKGVPIGLFYRDIYWLFPEYRERVGRLISTGTIALYRHDLRQYSRILRRLYLPSLEMGTHIPIVPRRLMDTLPPGADIIPRTPPSEKGTDLNLFYVGGLSEHYRLEECVKAVGAAPNAHMVLCTRDSEWAAVKDTYAPLGGDSVQVIHKSGDDLTPYYNQADLAVLFVEPQPYWSFAVPFKLFEYIGRGIPIIATKGTWAGQMVAENNLGWTLPYRASALVDLLADLRAHPDKLAAAATAVAAAAPAHTWTARATQVITDLTGRAPTP
ncbi:MAG: glycosyltransferase [Actinomycetaceae bacterium]|nr:glycosyltransferase [Actinomycetaceae bacterium]